jgi:hypothetical protein
MVIVIAVALVDCKILPLSDALILYAVVMVPTLAANPEIVEVFVFPPVNVPVVEMLPVVKAMSFPVFVQSVFTRSQAGEAEVPVLT